MLPFLFIGAVKAKLLVDCVAPCNCSFDYNKCPNYDNDMPDYKEGDPIIVTDAMKAAINKYLPAYLQAIEAATPPVFNKTFGISVSSGLAGDALLYAHLYRNTRNQSYLTKATDYITVALKNVDLTDGIDFLTSSVGVHAVAGAINRLAGKSTEANERVIREAFRLASNASFDSFFVGRAGLLAVGIFANAEFGREVISTDELHRVGQEIINRGAELGGGKFLKWKSPFGPNPVVGAGAGSAGVMAMLLGLPRITENQTAATLLKNTLDYVISLQKADGNIPEPDGSHDVAQWCHGAPGHLAALGEGFRVFREQKYLEAASKAADYVWQKGLIVKGLGLCHGITGNTYMQHYLYRVTNDRKYLYRAVKFQEFVLTKPLLSDPTVFRTPDPAEENWEFWFGSYKPGIHIMSDLLGDFQRGAHMPVFVPYL